LMAGIGFLTPAMLRIERAPETIAGAPKTLTASRTQTRQPVLRQSRRPEEAV